MCLRLLVFLGHFVCGVHHPGGHPEVRELQAAALQAKTERGDAECNGDIQAPVHHHQAACRLYVLLPAAHIKGGKLSFL